MTDDLDAQATAFAEDLTRTVRALVPACAPFAASTLKGSDRVWVRQEPSTGIPLSVDGKPILTLKVEYFCSLDSSDQWLTTEDSDVKVHVGPQASGEPLFHYHYRRDASDDLPAAHLHVHAHRDVLSHLLATGGTKTRRAKARAKRDQIPRMRDVHFPLGGHRFRPCLEDILEMLINEFGVDHPPKAMKALGDGREKWRRSQVRTVVRDAPSEAIDFLRANGYDVTLRSGEKSLKDKRSRLRDL